MVISYIQGIVSYPVAGDHSQLFLQYNSGTVRLLTADGPTTVTVANGQANYLITEAADVVSAWTNIPVTQVWLYWDINRTTAVRTFGFTSVHPTYSTTAPSSPAADQHWFNTASKKMFVRRGSAWVEVIRVFAASITAGAFSPMGIAGLKPYAGTQVGITTPYGNTPGNIIVTDAGTPILKTDGTFFTTATRFFTNGAPATTVKLEADVFTATAITNIPAYQVTKFLSFGHVDLATYDDEQTTIIAMAMEDILTGQPGTLCMQGVITNPEWNWTTVGAPLWIDGTIPGTLTDVDPFLSDPLNHLISKPPVARVISPTSLFFDQGMGGKGDRGSSGSAAVVVAATTTSLGIVALSHNPTDPTNPIVVETTDSRMTDQRVPLAHNQDATTINVTSSGSFTGPNAQLALQQLDAAKLNLSGGTLTGPLILSTNPTANLEAATKQYVDSHTWALAGLTDVVLTTPTTSQALIYNGSNWVNHDTVSTVSITTANGISGAVATATTTPAITLTLGAITPTSVNATGDITALTLHGALTGNVTGNVTGFATSFSGPLLGDVTGTQGATILATVNSSIGTWGTVSSVPTFAVNSKGLITSASNTSISITPTQAGLSNIVNSLQVINAGGAPSIQEGITSARPIAGTSGRLFVDTTLHSLYRDNGASWDQLGGISGVLAVASGGTNSGTALNNNRVMQSSGGAIIEAAAITANRALVSDANGIPTHSLVSSTTLGYLDATSSVQSQLNSKAADNIVIKKDGSVTYTAAQPMGGFKITGLGDGAAPTDAVNKGQLDAAVIAASGYTPIFSPAGIADSNIIDDSLSTPPITPLTHTTYLVGAAATAAWVGLEGHVLQWNGSTWVDVLGRAVVISDNLGVSFDFGVGAGGLVGQDNNIATITNATPGSYAYTFTTPVNNNVVLVTGPSSLDASSTYAYNSTIPVWVKISTPSNITPGIALSTVFNTMNVNTDGSSVSVNLSNQLQVAGVGGSTAADVNSATLVALAATNANTPSTIVRRDASGNFNAGTITATFTGDVTGNVTGNVSGSAASFTGNLAGDVSGPQGTTLLATVNANTGSWGTADSVPTINVNGKGLITSSSNTAISITPSAAGLGSVVNSLQVINAGGAPSIQEDITGNRPAAGVAGRIYIDTTLDLIYRDTGSTWVAIGGGGGGGGITSIDASGGVTGMSFTGGPITTFGTLTLGGTLLTTNGGTGLTTVGGAGTVLTSNGTTLSFQAPSGGSTIGTTQVSTNASFYPLFVASSTNSTQAVDLGTGLTFNPSTNILSTTEVAVTTVSVNGVAITSAGAPVVGQVLTADTTTTATWQTPAPSGVGLTDDTTTNAIRYPVYASAITGTMITAYTSSTKYYYNPSTGTLSATNFTSLSDENYKDNICDLVNPMDTVNQLRGVSFNWKDNGFASYGVIAQEVEKVLPAVVNTNSEGQKTVDYQAMIAFLIETIKDLDARVKYLESK